MSRSAILLALLGGGVLAWLIWTAFRAVRVLRRAVDEAVRQLGL